MKLTWNFYSGIVAPILTLTAISVLILFPTTKQLSFSLYFSPFILLSIVMINILLFWLSYLLYIRKKISKRFIIILAKLSIKLGQLCLIVLIIVTFLKLISNFTSLTYFDYKVDSIYWLISIWTFIEIIHHYFYKILYDKESFLEIVNDEKNSSLTSPFGGAIGKALKKLEQ